MKAASGRACRKRSMTPKAIPLPPCTARPAGLSRTSRTSSSYRIGGIETCPGAAAPGFYLVLGIAINANGLILARGSDGHAYLLEPRDEE